MNNHDRNPFFELLGFIFQALATVILFASFGLTMYFLPVYWRKLRAATTRSERSYYAMRFTSLWCLFYGLGMIFLMAVDAMAWDARLIHHWPTLTVHLSSDSLMSHETSVCMDILWSFILATIATFAANHLGFERGDEYCRPDRAIAADKVADVMQRYEQVKLSDPHRSPLFNTLPADVRRRQEVAYKARLADIESRVRAVHQIWGRRSPI